MSAFLARWLEKVKRLERLDNGRSPLVATAIDAAIGAALLFDVLMFALLVTA